MGEYNSSRTRVVPVFERLYQQDSTGAAWLSHLLSLGSNAKESELQNLGSLVAGHEGWWGVNERRLSAPPKLLEWLVHNVEKPSSPSLWGSRETRAKRERLAARDFDTIKEALELLKAGGKSDWHVLEGESSPDAYLETEHAVIVIEGKRTEAKATMHTTWMPLRSQMLRHMDAAWEKRKGRRVYGLMIVEGDGGADAIDLNDHWREESSKQRADETLEKSLPHRSAEERREIASGFLGATTWQRVCAEFDLPWPPG